MDCLAGLESQSQVDIFLDARGELDRVRLELPQLRGLERRCLGRPVDDMPNLSAWLCGTYPDAHRLAAAKALDRVYGVEPPPTARKLRELFYCVSWAIDQHGSGQAAALPPLAPGPDSPPGHRNIVGVLRKVGAEVASGLRHLLPEGSHPWRLIHDRTVFPAWDLPGGVRCRLDNVQRGELEELGHHALELARYWLRVFDREVLRSTDYVRAIADSAYTQRTHYLGLVDQHNCVNLHDGHLRVISPDGKVVACFAPAAYQEYLGQQWDPDSTLPFIFLKQTGWQGVKEDATSGIFQTTPLARCNVADGMATPLAQAEYTRFYEVLGGKPVHHTLAAHWARLIEVLYAAERWLELTADPDITGADHRAIPAEAPGEGVGCVESPQGLLIHHYAADENGLLARVQLLPGTLLNLAPLCLALQKAAARVIHQGRMGRELVLCVEALVRAYDPGFPAAAHRPSDQAAWQVRLRSPQGEILQLLSGKLQRPSPSESGPG